MSTTSEVAWCGIGIAYILHARWLCVKAQHTRWYQALYKTLQDKHATLMRMLQHVKNTFEPVPLLSISGCIAELATMLTLPNTSKLLNVLYLMHMALTLDAMTMATLQMTRNTIEYCMMRLAASTPAKGRLDRFPPPSFYNTYWRRARYHHTRNRKMFRYQLTRKLTNVHRCITHVLNYRSQHITWLHQPVQQDSNTPHFSHTDHDQNSNTHAQRPWHKGCPIGGPCNGEDRQNDLQAQQVFNNTGLYMEKQLRQFCQVHALNALFGTAVQLADMVKFCKEHASNDTELGTQLRKSIAWDQHSGNFADAVIDAFLHYHSAPTVRLSSIACNIPVGSSAECFLANLPAGHDAFMLRWHKGTESYQAKG